MQTRFALAIASLICLAFVACSDSDDDEAVPSTAESTSAESNEDPETGTVDGALNCTRQQLESDFGSEPLIGPGVDPETGQLLAQGEPFVVSTTYLALQGTPEAQQLFGELVEAITEDMATRDGLLAVSTGFSRECGTARTLTAWRDEEAMQAFVLGEAHIAAITAVAQVSRGGSVVMSWAESDATQVSWTQVVPRLANHTGSVY